jgi:hypothetical protein
VWGSKGFVIVEPAEAEERFKRKVQKKGVKINAMEDLSHCKIFHVCTGERRLKTNNHIMPQDTTF